MLTEDENGSPVITPGTGSTNLDLTIAVNKDGGVALEDVDAYTRDPYLDDAGTVIAPAENGSSAVTLEDGTKITVTGIKSDGLRLVVRPITEPELVAWFEKCVAPYGTNIYPMDIYFVDSRGVRTENNGTITVTVEMRKDYSEPIVCCVAPDGTVTVMSSSVDGKKITFQMNHNSYYVLAEKLDDDTSPQPGTPGGTAADTSTSGGSSAQGAQTGDSGNLWLWGTVMLLAFGGLVEIVLFGKKKKRNAD